MKIVFNVLTPGNAQWLSASKQINEISWSAGKYLAEKMREKQFVDWEAVIAGYSTENELICFCTVTKQDSYENKQLLPFIGYVFVQEKFRGNGFSRKLLQHAEIYLKKQNLNLVYLVSNESGLYEKMGYQVIEKVKTRHGEVEKLYKKQLVKKV